MYWKKEWEEFFKLKEFEDGLGECEMDPDFMDRLVQLRREYNRPMVINSGYRSIAWNTTVGGARSSAHLEGLAVDIKCSGGEDAYDLIRLAIKHGFTGIGVSLKGPHYSRFIHLDTAPLSSDRPRPAVWSY